MYHFGGQVVKRPWALLDAFAVTHEHRGTKDYRVRFVGTVPMLPHMDSFRRANQQLRAFRLGINVEDADLGGAFTEVGNNLIPLQILVVLEDSLWHFCLGALRGLLRILTTSAGHDEADHQ